MKVISKRSVDLSKARRISYKTYESIVYVKDGKVFKMYKKDRFYKNGLDRLKVKEVKVRMLATSKASQIVKADRIIKSGKLIDGIRMNFVENKGNLYEFSRVYNNLAKFLNVGFNASIGLKEIHNDPRNIIISDNNLSNILFDKNLQTYYVDSDSFSIDGLDPTSVSDHFIRYCENRGKNPYRTFQKDDRFQLMYELISTIFGAYAEEVSVYEYDKLSEQVKTLKNMRTFFLNIKNSKKIPTVPYFHDIVDEGDFSESIDYKMPIIKM